MRAVIIGDPSKVKIDGFSKGSGYVEGMLSRVCEYLWEVILLTLFNVAPTHTGRV